MKKNPVLYMIIMSIGVVQNDSYSDSRILSILIWPDGLALLLEVEKEVNKEFLLGYLATFGGDLPTQLECEA